MNNNDTIYMGEMIIILSKNIILYMINSILVLGAISMKYLISFEKVH